MSHLGRGNASGDFLVWNGNSWIPENSPTFSGSIIIASGANLIFNDTPATTGTMRFGSTWSIASAVTGTNLNVLRSDDGHLKFGDKLSKMLITGSDIFLTGNTVRISSSNSVAIGGGSDAGCSVYVGGPYPLRTYQYDIDASTVGYMRIGGTQLAEFSTNTVEFSATTAKFSRGGFTVATIGDARLANNYSFYGRNAANTSDIQLLNFKLNNNVELGDFASQTVVSGSTIFLTGSSINLSGSAVTIGSTQTIISGTAIILATGSSGYIGTNGQIASSGHFRTPTLFTWNKNFNGVDHAVIDCVSYATILGTTAAGDATLIYFADASGCNIQSDVGIYFIALNSKLSLGSSGITNIVIGGPSTTKTVISGTSIFMTGSCISLFSESNRSEGMMNGMFIGNCVSAPTGSPGTGGYMYVENGAAKWRGSGGTTTTFGPADPHCPRCGMDYAIESRNDRSAGGWHKALCFNCLTRALDKLGVDRSEYMIFDEEN